MKAFINILAGVAVATILTITAVAADTAKGGGKRLTELNSPAQVAAVEKGDLVVTTCPKCRTVMQNRIKATAKGGGSAVERVAIHGCPGCGARIETTGHGKAKTDKVTHVCSHCGSNEAFCSVLKSKDADAK